MSQRRRPLSLEPVEDRCVPSGGRWDHRPPPFAGFHRGEPAEARRFDRREDGPASRGRSSGPDVAALLVPQAQPPRPVQRVETARPAVEDQTARPDVVVSSPVPAAFAAARSAPRPQATLPDPPGAVPTLAVSTTVPGRPFADGPSPPTAPAPAPNLTPPAPSPAPAAPPSAAPAWIAATERPADVPTPDEIVLPGVAVEPPAGVTVAETVREAVAVAVPLAPLVGALPVDLIAVERAAADLLAGLTEAAVPESSVGRWGWAGLAVLAAGGLIHALRPAPDRRHTAAVGNDSALARWESRHARPVR